MADDGLVLLLIVPDSHRPIKSTKFEMETFERLAGYRIEKPKRSQEIAEDKHHIT